jgi:hypothetical protein
MNPIWILVAVLVLVALTVVDAIRTARPARPEDGCCGCGADLCDAIVGRSEGYCMKCLNEWPAAATPLDQLGVVFFPGRGDGAR